jgi:hypothetical protein
MVFWLEMPSIKIQICFERFKRCYMLESRQKCSYFQSLCWPLDLWAAWVLCLHSGGGWKSYFFLHKNVVSGSQNTISNSDSFRTNCGFSEGEQAVLWRDPIFLVSAALAREKKLFGGRVEGCLFIENVEVYIYLRNN